MLHLTYQHGALFAAKAQRKYILGFFYMYKVLFLQILALIVLNSRL